MEEEVDFDIIIEEFHDQTIRALEKYLSHLIKLSIEDHNIIIIVYDAQPSRGLFFNKRHCVKLAEFLIAHMPKYENTLTVFEEGRPYYDIFKKIGDEVGYDTIYHKWR